MANANSKNELGADTQERLEKLLSMSPDRLNKAQLNFIKARSAYLTEEEADRFLDVEISEEDDTEEESEEEAEEEVSEKEEDEEEESDDSDENEELEDMSRTDLFTKIDEINADRDEDDQIKKTGTNEDLIERIQDA